MEKDIKARGYNIDISDVDLQDFEVDGNDHLYLNAEGERYKLTQDDPSKFYAPNSIKDGVGKQMPDGLIKKYLIPNYNRKTTPNEAREAVKAQALVPIELQTPSRPQLEQMEPRRL